jgi:hypothetical protein
LRNQNFLRFQRASKRPSKIGEPRVLTDEDLTRLPRIFAEPLATLYDKRGAALVYIFNSSGTRGAGKFVVRIGFATPRRAKPRTKTRYSTITAICLAPSITRSAPIRCASAPTASTPLLAVRHKERLRRARALQNPHGQLSIPWGNIPAHPFLGLPNEDERKVLAILEEHLQANH